MKNTLEETPIHMGKVAWIEHGLTDGGITRCALCDTIDKALGYHQFIAHVADYADWISEDAFDSGESGSFDVAVCSRCKAEANVDQRLGEFLARELPCWYLGRSINRLESCIHEIRTTFFRPLVLYINPLDVYTAPAEEPEQGGSE